MTTQEAIQGFLSSSRFALVGVSRNPEHISRELYSAFREDGFEVVPVNPNMNELDGVPVFPSVSGIDPVVESVYLAVPSDSVMEVIDDAIAAGVKYVWFHYDGTMGSVPEEAIAKALSAGMSVVPGACYLHHTSRRSGDGYQELALEDYL